MIFCTVEKLYVCFQEGVYVRNLYLEGADWNYEKACLCESVPLKFFTDLPIIQFKPVQTITRKKGLMLD